MLASPQSSGPSAAGAAAGAFFFAFGAEEMRARFGGRYLPPSFSAGFAARTIAGGADANSRRIHEIEAAEVFGWVSTPFENALPVQGLSL